MTNNTRRTNLTSLARHYLLSMEAVECTAEGFAVQQRLHRMIDVLHARGHGKRSFI